MMPRLTHIRVDPAGDRFNGVTCEILVTLVG